MEKGVLTYVDLDSAPHLVGRLWARARQKKGSASFEYDPAWLQNPTGALRFKAEEGGPFLRESNAGRVPPLVELPKLLSAAQRVIHEDETDEDLRLLLAPGFSLGSRDLEDVIAVVDGRQELVGEIQAAQSDVRSYLGKEIPKVLDTRKFLDALSGHLAPDSASRQRAAQALCVDQACRCDSQQLLDGSIPVLWLRIAQLYVRNQ
jgi:hypothetical protein